MIFRTPDGDFLEINKSDYNNENDYNNTLMELFLSKPFTNKKNNINQVDYINNIILRQQKSRL